MRDRLDPLIAERAPWLFQQTLRARLSWIVLGRMLSYARTIELGTRYDDMEIQALMADLAGRIARKVTVSGLENVPATGRALVVSNHPTGIADGVVLHHLLSRRRGDAFFYANSDIIRVLPQFAEIIVPVEWREDRRSQAKARETMTATRRAFDAERLGVIFPSGRLAKRRGLRLHERDWMASASMIARKFALPVIPVHIRARNSALFYSFDAIHDTLRDITLFHETLNKDVQPYHITVGRPIDGGALPKAGDEGIEVLRDATPAPGLGTPRRDRPDPQPARLALARGADRLTGNAKRRPGGRRPHALVRSRRLELPRVLPHSDLNAARLPIPPRPRTVRERGGGNSGAVTAFGNPSRRGFPNLAAFAGAALRDGRISGPQCPLEWITSQPRRCPTPTALAEMEARAVASILSRGGRPRRSGSWSIRRSTRPARRPDPRRPDCDPRSAFQSTRRGGAASTPITARASAWSTPSSTSAARGRDVRALRGRRLEGVGDRRRWPSSACAASIRDGPCRRLDRTARDLAPLPDGSAREDKIAAIGIRLRRWVSFHGISVNIEPDLSHFDGIVPCGITGHGVTSLVDLGLPVTMDDLDAALKRTFAGIFPTA